MEFIIGILMLIIAALAYRTSVLQKRLDEKQLNLNAFDRNFKTFSKLEDYIHKIIAGRITLNDTSDFIAQNKEVQFLFGKDIIEFTEEVHSIGVELALLNEKINLLTNVGELSREEFSERKKYMSEKSKLIKDAFVILPAQLKDHFDQILKLNKEASD